MLTSLRRALHRAAVRRHLREAAYLASDRQLREDVGSRMRPLSSRAVREGWSARTTAAILVAIWVAGHARALDPERRLRVAEAIMAQERHGPDPLHWLEDFHAGRLNPVGIDLQLMRFNLARGTIGAWIAEGLPIDRRTGRVLVAMTAWALSDMASEEIEHRLADLLDDLRS